MHLILTGATGLIGSGVLDAMLKNAAIRKISVLSRSPVRMAEAAKDPRVNVIIHKDFSQYDPELLKQLEGANGAVWALGVSQFDVNAEQYVQVTKTFTIAAAGAFSTLPPGDEPFRFVFVSGDGATHKPGRFTPIFGRVKGEVESRLAEMSASNPRLFATSVRPCGVDPTGHKEIASYIPDPGLMYRTMRMTLLPIMRPLLPSKISPTRPLGQFLTKLALGNYDKELKTEKRDIISLEGDSKVINNEAFRRFEGL